MTSKLLENKESYVRLQDTSGSSIIASSGALQVINPNLDSLTFSSGLIVNVGILPVVGSHGNAWNNATVSASGTSTTVDCQYSHYISIFGNTDTATTLTIQVSQNGDDWYSTNNTIVMVGSGNFYQSLQSGARYLRLSSSAGAIITATISAK